MEVNEHRLAAGLKVGRFEKDEKTELAAAMAEQGWKAGESTVANGDWN